VPFAIFLLPLECHDGAAWFAVRHQIAVPLFTKGLAAFSFTAFRAYLRAASLCAHGLPFLTVIGRPRPLSPGLTTRGIIAPFVLDGPINRDALTYLKKVLTPELRPGDIVIMDNLSSHKGGHGCGR
jgi:hypothetical protein